MWSRRTDHPSGFSFESLLWVLENLVLVSGLSLDVDPVDLTPTLTSKSRSGDPRSVRAVAVRRTGIGLTNSRDDGVREVYMFPLLPGDGVPTNPPDVLQCTYVTGRGPVVGPPPAVRTALTAPPQGTGRRRRTARSSSTPAPTGSESPLVYDWGTPGVVVTGAMDTLKEKRPTTQVSAEAVVVPHDETPLHLVDHLPHHGLDPLLPYVSVVEGPRFRSEDVCPVPYRRPGPFRNPKQ